MLIVDDSIMIGEKIREYISELENINIIGHALSGLEAIQFISEQVPDIILLDINMPGLNGFDVLTWIRNRFIQTTVIMLTNHSSPNYRQKSSGLGADYFFDKTTEFEKLPDLINRLFENK